MTAATPTVPVLTVVQLDEAAPLGRFAGWLDGVRVRLVRADAGEEVGPVADLDGLLVLGGRMSAHAEGEPGVAATRDLLVGAVAAGVPTLGICLGAQLLAVATGGRVHVDAPPGHESGIVEVRWRPGATGDPLVGNLAASGARSTPMPTMHADAIVDLPPAATWLAASRMYPYQAFRVGSAWGVQFHPETSPATLHAWAVDAGEDVAAVDAAATEHDPAVVEAGRHLAQAFTRLVTAHHVG